MNKEERRNQIEIPIPRLVGEEGKARITEIINQTCTRREYEYLTTGMLLSDGVCTDKELEFFQAGLSMGYGKVDTEEGGGK